MYAIGRNHRHRLQPHQPLNASHALQKEEFPEMAWFGSSFIVAFRDIRTSLMFYYHCDTVNETSFSALSYIYPPLHRLLNFEMRLRTVPAFGMPLTPHFERDTRNFIFLGQH